MISFKFVFLFIYLGVNVFFLFLLVVDDIVFMIISNCFFDIEFCLNNFILDIFWL